jgi:hypothetical protein
VSKGTIGTFLGAGIGFLIGGPAGAQIGALIGGAVGSSFDTIEGRKVGEMSSPRAQEGEPIPLTFGSARVTGRLMSTGAPVIVTESEGGKGGPKVENETAYLSYSILICESSELRDSSITDILMVIENNKIVYDMRASPAVSAADSAKWKQNKVFYFGGESQGVDPTEQMIHGSGNVPAYRGIARMVVTDEDVTQHGGSIPTYEFVTTQCDIESPYFLLVTGAAITGGDPVFAEAEATEPLAFTGIAQSTGADILNAVPGFYDGVWVVAGNEEARVSYDERDTWPALANDHDAYGQIAAGPFGWLLAAAAGPASFYDLTAKAASIEDGFTSYAFEAENPPGTTFRANGEESLMCRYTGGYYWLDIGAQGELVKTSGLGDPLQVVYYHANNTEAAAFWDIEVFDGAVYAAVAWNRITPRAQVRRSNDGGVTWPDVIIDKAITDADAPLQLQAGGDVLLVHCRGDGHVWTSVDGFASSHATGIGGDRTANVPIQAHLGIGRHIAYAPNGKFYMISRQNTTTPSIGDKCVYTEDGLTFSAPVSLPIKNLYGIAASDGTFYTPPDDILLPDVDDFSIDPVTGTVRGPTRVALDCAPSLSSIVDKLDARAGIPSANTITTALDAIEVPGYAVDQFMTVAEAKEPLRQVYFFDCPEYDDAIRYRLRGGATDFTVDPNDLIVGEEATEKGVRGQTVEFPKRLHVQYVDPATGYKPMKQTAERISPDIRVKGELVAGANITLDADTAKQAADIGLKTAWTEREDSRDIILPMDYFADAIAAHTFTLDGRRYRITDMRVEAGAIYIESKYDRISAYSSAATGTVGPTPGAGSTLSGPTASAIMNLPVLRDTDDNAGIYWAAAGLLDTWPGAQLQLSRDGMTFSNNVRVTQSATMGVLTASLASASRYGMDNTNTLSVRVTATGGALDSTDYDGLLAGDNAAAILYADGTAEIVQFQTATETAPGEYDLTGLLRGRKDTVAGAHAVDAQFVLLDEKVRFVGLRADDLGKTLTFRAVSINTPAASNATQTLTVTTLESLREWAPYNITVSSDGDGGYCIEWIGRARLGSSVTPIHSQWFEGYRVTFTVAGVTQTVDTTDQELCVDADTLTGWFGSSYGLPQVTVQTRSRVPTVEATPGEPTYEDEPLDFTIAGNIPDWCVGVPMRLYCGPATSLRAAGPFQAYGGLWDATFYGLALPGIFGIGDNRGSCFLTGLPHTAGTYTTDLDFVATGPTGASTGTDTIAQSVTIAAAPTYSYMDWGKHRPNTDTYICQDLQTADCGPSGIGQQISIGGASTGKVACAYVVSGLTGGGSVSLAVVAATEGTGIGYGVAGVYTYSVGNGTYIIELDADTGAIAVRDSGSTLDTDTLALTYAYDGEYRFGWATSVPAPGAVIQCNMGNTAWPFALTGGYGGMPMPSVIFPAGFDPASASSTSTYVLSGTDSPTSASTPPGGAGGTGIIHADVGKSSGQYRYQISALGGSGTKRVGLCQSGETDVLGEGLNSIGVRDATTSDRNYLVAWNFGTATEVRFSSSGSHSRLNSVRFGVDFAAGTVEIWILANMDTGGEWELLTTLSGLPAGTYYPAGYGAGSTITLTPQPDGPPGYSDWTR